MKTPKYIPEIDKSVFWDCYLEEKDFTTYSDFVVCRVFNYCNFQEIADVIICYGREYIKELLLSTNILNYFGLEAASAFLSIPEKEFKCYTLKQFPRSY